MAQLITAIKDTWLKKTTNMAFLLSEKSGEKSKVEEGRSFGVKQQVQAKGRHLQCELDYGAGTWWIYSPHWDIEEFKVAGNNVEAIYQDAMAFMLQWEGGYVNHPNDRGGATNRGVIQRNYDAYRRSEGLPTRSVRYIETGEVKEIYRTRYWEASKANILAERSREVAIVHFDWAVNSGVSRAMRTLQECLRTTPDGVWGANTEAAWKSSNPSEILNCYLQRREQLYRLWGRGSQLVFLNGWLNRLNSLKRTIG